jgi:hypothetical protein
VADRGCGARRRQPAKRFRGLDFEAAVDLLLALNVAKTLRDLSPLWRVCFANRLALDLGVASGRIRTS